MSFLLCVQEMYSRQTNLYFNQWLTLYLWTEYLSLISTFQLQDVSYVWVLLAWKELTYSNMTQFKINTLYRDQ
jgi:hypothetical protein